jgi:hypothetical protein
MFGDITFDAAAPTEVFTKVSESASDGSRFKTNLVYLAQNASAETLGTSRGSPRMKQTVPNSSDPFARVRHQWELSYPIYLTGSGKTASVVIRLDVSHSQFCEEIFDSTNSETFQKVALDNLVEFLTTSGLQAKFLGGEG